MPEDKVVGDIRRQFSKTELIKLARELGLKEIAQSDVNSGKIVSQLLKDLDANGIPETDGPDACSDLMFEFLVVAEYVDENGNLLEEEESEPEKEEQKAEPVKLPECFSYADERDPSCTKCKVLVMCKKARLDSRPECFGKLFSEHEPECAVCLEAVLCKKEISSRV